MISIEFLYHILHLGKWACFNCVTTLSHEEVMASIQAPSTFIPSKICSSAEDDEEMGLQVAPLISGDMIPEAVTETLVAGSK